MILRKFWFFITTLQKNRFKNGDRPDENTFQNLTDSVTFKLESSDRAKENNQSLPIDKNNLQGLSVIATDTEAITRTSGINIVNGENDRSVVVKPEQLPSSIAANDPGSPWSPNPLVSVIDGTVTTREHTKYYLDKTILTAYIQANSTQLWSFQGSGIYLDPYRIQNVNTFLGNAITRIDITRQTYFKDNGGIVMVNNSYVKIGSNGTDLDIDPPSATVGLYNRRMTSLGTGFYSDYRLAVGGSNGYYGTFVNPNYNGFPFARNPVYNTVDLDQEENPSIVISKGILRLAPWEETVGCPGACAPGAKDAFMFVGTNYVDNNSNTYRNTQIGGSGKDKPFGGTITWMPGTVANLNQVRGISIMPIPNFENSDPNSLSVSDVREITITQTQEHLSELNKKFQKSIATFHAGGGLKLHELNPFYESDVSYGYGWGDLKNLTSYKNVIFVPQETNETFVGQGRTSWVGRPLWYGHNTMGSVGNVNTYQKKEFVMMDYQGTYPARPAKYTTPLPADLAPAAVVTAADYNALKLVLSNVITSYNALLDRLYETNLFRE